MTPEDAALKARRDAALGPAYRLFYEEPLHIVRGEGVWLFDADGRRYLDAYNNVASVGHCHPVVVEALAEQARALNTHTRYLSDGIVDYAEALIARLGFVSGDVNAMFACTGSEANDLALRIARAATGNRVLLVSANAYHGVTAAIAEASPSLGPDNPLGDAVRTVPAPISGPQAGAVFADGVRAVLADLKAEGRAPAALLVDTIFSSDGVFAEPAGFLAEAVDAVRSAGGLFIADEVQAGFARTGEAFWGFARHGVVPDMVTMGKPMANGHPVAAVIARADLVAAFAAKVRYFNTFGGNPVSAAAAQAVLDVIEREDLAANAQTVGAYLAAGLSAIQHPAIRDVRQAGLFLGVQLDSAATAARVVDHMKRESGVLISATGPAADALKIRPPLVLKAEEADLIVGAVGAALAG